MIQFIMLIKDRRPSDPVSQRYHSYLWFRFTGYSPRRRKFSKVDGVAWRVSFLAFIQARFN